MDSTPQRPRLMARAIIRSLVATAVAAAPLVAQEQSVRPGVNDAFRDPDVEEFIGRFEVESREVYVHRGAIVEACRLQPGMVVADVGAGTGLFTRMFAEAVGPEGRVLAVDIAPKFLEHIDATCRAAGIRNVETVLGTADSTGLPPGAVDVAFICDTYHHFEFPQRTMASIRRALKPGGRVVVVDFRRIPGESSEWVLEHVRAGQETVEREIVQAGFRRLETRFDELTENYLMEFERTPTEAP